MTRSVAEVIGWELGHEKRWDFDDETWHFTSERDGDGGRVTRLGYPTADDLLAWLREQGWDVLPVRDGMGEPRPLTALPVEFVLHKRPLHVHHVEAPTLLAALERAVLAVAGES